MNIAISGWNGAGSSTLCLILAKSLRLKLFQGSQTFRVLGEKLSYSQTGNDRIKADNYLEYNWGFLYDKYIDYLLLNEKGLIIETDIAAFRLGKRKEYFSIFLTANQNVRASRVVVDGRTSDKEVLIERDKSLQKNYMDLHGIDWLNLDEIKAKYNLIIDNSELNIAGELEITYGELLRQKLIDETQCLDFVLEENTYWELGKQGYQNYLKANNLIMDGKDIIHEMRKLYKKEVSEFPKVLQEAINNI